MYVHALQDDKTRRNALAAHLTAAGASTASHQRAQTGKATTQSEVVGAAAATSSLYTTGGIAGPSPLLFLHCNIPVPRAWAGLAGCLLQVTGGGSTAMHRAGYRASERERFCCSSHAGVCTPSAADELVAALVRGGGASEEEALRKGTGIQGRCV